ncbi:MAG: hypothetical protein KIS77_11155 [Saprospiraceae bacterium]|nr:hypothetical protein [Saprospiraceae bacterium]
MTKKIIILIVFCYVSSHYVLAQSKATIDPFFEREFSEKVRFEIDLPYKVKITPQTIKRSEAPEFLVYNFTSRKKRHKVDFSLSLTQNNLDHSLKMYKEAGGILDKEIRGGTYLIKFIDNSNTSNYLAIIIKQVSVGSKTICLELTVSGEQKLLDKELPKLLNSFYASTVSH